MSATPWRVHPRRNPPLSLSVSETADALDVRPLVHTVLYRTAVLHGMHRVRRRALAVVYRLSACESLFLASCMAAAVQRKAIEAERQRFTLRLTRRTVPIMFSIMLVHARERSQLGRQPEPDDREDFVQPLQQRLGDAGRVSF